MLTNAESNLADAISLHDRASKGRSGRVIATTKTLKPTLEQYLKQERRSKKSKFVITTERAEKFSANGIAVFFKRLCTSLGFEGCSSHSGRRTFNTNCARKVSLAGCSLRDVMMLSGHRSISNVQLYIDQDALAQKKLIEMITTWTTRTSWRGYAVSSFVASVVIISPFLIFRRAISCCFTRSW
jgi:integrase